jgi:hypothetical protein
MIEIQYPPPSFRVQHKNSQPYIFDEIRRKWLQLTEEEWVRQNFVQYLLHSMHYPKTLIALEKEIQLGELKKRFDILVYNKNHKPWMLIECKAPQVSLTDGVLHQVLRYNISLPANYLIITNGNHTIGWQKMNNILEEISAIPEFISND